MKKVWKYGITALLIALFASGTLCGCGIFGTFSQSGNGGNGGNSGGQIEQPASKSEFASGSGTEEDPYIIAEPYQWTNINNHLSSCFELSADLNMGDIGDMPSIGTIEQPFVGTFDGKNHVLHSGDKTGGNGIFGIISGGTVKNLTIKDFRISAKSAIAGPFAAQIKMGALIENCHLIDVTFSFNTWNIHEPYESGYYWYGGIVGVVSSMATMKYCSAKIVMRNVGDFQYTADYVVGGIAAKLEGGSIDACSVNGTVTSYNALNGGLIGYIIGGKATNLLSECTFTGTGSWGETIYGGLAVKSEGGYHIEYGISICTFVGRGTEGYYQITEAFEDKTSHYFSPTTIEFSNDILDSAEWKDNKFWEKGKLHPELVSYEEYLVLTAGTAESE